LEIIWKLKIAGSRECWRSRAEVSRIRDNGIVSCGSQHDIQKLLRQTHKSRMIAVSWEGYGRKESCCSSRCWPGNYIETLRKVIKTWKRTQKGRRKCLYPTLPALPNLCTPYSF
jgi:hypothetical protein